MSIDDQPIVNSSNPQPHLDIYGPDQHPIKRTDIDHDAMKIVLRLQHSGYKAFIVGGGVRDLLLGKKPKDFDVSTDATPRQIKALFRNCRIIGRRFKLAHIYFSNGKAIEVSTFRDSADWPEIPDGDTNEQAPVASDNLYGNEVTDALRRDLTINGLFLDVSTMEIIDYVNGMRDIKEGIVRIIGDPEIRFREDPVRMLRAVRHSARNGFKIETKCWESILANSAKIAACPEVRVFDELKKDFTCGCFLTILTLLAETGLLQHLLPELLENNCALLTAESDFSRMIERVDDLALDDKELSPTVVLTIIALFISADSIRIRDIAERFEQHVFSERMTSCLRT